MKRLLYPSLLLSLANGAWAGDELPVTVLPPVTTVAEDSSASSSQTVVPSQADLGIELPPVDASILKAAKQQAAALTSASATSKRQSELEGWGMGPQ